MNKISLLLLLLIISCKSVVNTKEQNPLNLPWIKEKIESYEKYPFPRKSMISEYEYNGEIVFLVESCYQCPDAQSFVYNEKKEKLCTLGGMVSSTNNCPDFFDKAIKKSILWKNF